MKLTHIRLAVATVTAAVMVLVFTPSASAELLPEQFAALLNLPWPQAVPPLPTSTARQPHPVPGCKRPSIGCIKRDIQKLQTLRDKLGCDHRAIFPSTYLQVQLLLLHHVQQNRNIFGDFRWVATYVDTLFVDWYLWAFDDYAHGRAVAPAWKVAFDQAMHGETNAVQDMGMDINAHVQNDMAFVEADQGLRMPDGASRKPNHDAFNLVMMEGFPRVLQQLTLRYDPLAGTSDTISPVGNVSGTELVRFWREIVWRNAERALNAGTPTDYNTVAANNVDDTSASIHGNALAWANALAAPQVPGERARRDAYCHAQLKTLAGQQMFTFGLGHPWSHVHGRAVFAPARVTGPVPLPDLTLTLRNASGRLIGRSNAIYLDGYRKIRIPFKHKLKPGRYKLTAIATLTNGTTLKRTIRVRFRHHR